jgi:hypothetical protein
MPLWKSLTIVGLAMTLFGAAILSLTDLRGRSARKPTWDDLGKGLSRSEARFAFPLIAVGSALQIVGVLLAP